MRFKRLARTPYIVTDRKRSAARRWQMRQREATPLLAVLVAEQQVPIDDVMAERVKAWAATEQSQRDMRARRWRAARRILALYAHNNNRALLAYWNNHRWLPGDPGYLLDALHRFETGRLVIVGGVIVPARAVISAAELTSVDYGRKPTALGWLGRASENRR